MLMINGEEWFTPMMNSGWDPKQLYGGATENEFRGGGINWTWYYYPTLEEALEGLKVRDPNEYEIEMEYREGRHFEWERVGRQCHSMDEVFNTVKEKGLTDFSVDTSSNYPGDFFMHWREKKYSPAGSSYTICYDDGSRHGVENWGFRIHN